MNKKISNALELLTFLKNENKPYANFILERMDRDPETLKGLKTQKHHIIPKHNKGPNEKWNLIVLTESEHLTAHKLLHQDYKLPLDEAAVNLLSGQIEKGRQIIWEENQRRMREAGVGFFNSELQRELGRRPKKKRNPYARNKFIVEALGLGFDIQCCITGDIIEINPLECSSLVEVIDKLVQHPRMANERENWNQCKNKEKHYLVTGFTRTLTGHRDEKTGKAVFTIKNWRVLGINVNID